MRGVAKNGGTRGGISWWHLLLAKICEDQKKRFSQQNEVGFSLRKYVKVFGLKRKKTKNGVTPKW